MTVNRVGRESNQLDATLGEFWLKLREGTQLGRAYWSVIFRVGEENYPFVADEPLLQSAEPQEKKVETHTHESRWAHWWYLLENSGQLTQDGDYHGCQNSSLISRDCCSTYGAGRSLVWLSEVI